MPEHDASGEKPSLRGGAKTLSLALVFTLGLTAPLWPARAWSQGQTGQTILASAEDEKRERERHEQERQRQQQQQRQVEDLRRQGEERQRQQKPQEMEGQRQREQQRQMEDQRRQGEERERQRRQEMEGQRQHEQQRGPHTDPQPRPPFPLPPDAKPQHPVQPPPDPRPEPRTVPPRPVPPPPEAQPPFHRPPDNPPPPVHRPPEPLPPHVQPLHPGYWPPPGPPPRRHYYGQPYWVEPPYYAEPEQTPYADPWLQGLDIYLRPRLARLDTSGLPGAVEVTAFLDLDPMGRAVDAGIAAASGFWQLDQQVVALLRGSGPYPPPPPSAPGRVFLRLGYQPQGLYFMFINPGGY